jgi:hypothetical protein
MIVWLASYPRSGNTLVRLLLHHCFGVDGTYSVHPDVNLDNPSDVAWAGVVGHLELPAGGLAALRFTDGYHFVKTHDPRLATSAHPAIYIVRDGRDALVSHAHYIIERRGKGSDSGFDAMVQGLVWQKRKGGGWSNHVKAWTQRAAPVAVLRYEDLLQLPIVRMTAVLDALGIQLRSSGEQMPTFEELHARWPNFFRKGTIGQWRVEMPKRIRRSFWKRHKDAMVMMGYR